MIPRRFHITKREKGEPWPGHVIAVGTYDATLATMRLCGYDGRNYADRDDVGSPLYRFGDGPWFEVYRHFDGYPYEIRKEREAWAGMTQAEKEWDVFEKPLQHFTFEQRAKIAAGIVASDAADRDREISRRMQGR